MERNQCIFLPGTVFSQDQTDSIPRSVENPLSPWVISPRGKTFSNNNKKLFKLFETFQTRFVLLVYPCTKEMGHSENYGQNRALSEAHKNLKGINVWTLNPHSSGGTPSSQSIILPPLVIYGEYWSRLSTRYCWPWIDLNFLNRWRNKCQGFANLCPSQYRCNYCDHNTLKGRIPSITLKCNALFSLRLQSLWCHYIK